MRTLAIPGRHTPAALADATERSSTRPSTNGPRSVTRTTTDCPVARFVTLMSEFIGSVRWAAVNAFWSKICPLAPRWLWYGGPYQLDRPSSVEMGEWVATNSVSALPPASGTLVAVVT